MTPEARRALELRLAVSKSSVSKLDALALRARDGRVRDGFLYYGAHTGRWAGRGIQFQNFPRGTMKFPKSAKVAEYEKAILRITNGEDVGYIEHEDLGRSWTNAPLDVVASCLRGAFQAPPGYHFVVCDFAQVELRVLAWLSNCQEMQDVFRKNGDLYMAFAAEHLYRIPVDQVAGRQRQVSKSAVLGCGYGQGAGYERYDKNGDPESTGLWGYAAKMGVSLTQEESFNAVRAFRTAYRPIVSYWYASSDAAIAAVENPGEAFYAGPVIWQTTAPEAKILFAILPSGRRLFYLRPETEINTYGRLELTYEGVNGFTKKWDRLRTYGGHLVENVTQAVARDLMAEAQLACDAAGFTIVGHAHDEIICLEKIEGHRLSELERIMSTVPDWANGLLLGAEGYESTIYRK